MTSYKLTYFDSRGRAEPCRLLFAAKGVDYEDIRMAREKWADFKPKTPTGQLPVLEVDGKMIGQSMTIARYLARKFDMCGNDAPKQAQCDMIVDTISDLLSALIPAIFEKDEKEKDKKLKAFATEKLPSTLAILEKLCPEGGQFIKDELTWADLVFFNASSNLAQFTFKWEDYPKLAAVNKKVGDNPKIKAWVEKRPKTKM